MHHSNRTAPFRRVLTAGISCVTLALLARPAAAAVPTVTFNQDAATAREEGLVPATLTLTRSSTEGELVVEYTTDARTFADVSSPFRPIPFTVKDRDYAPLPGRVVFAPGQAQATLTVKPLPHYHFRKYRKDRVLKITLTPAAGYTLGATPAATVTIVDDPSSKRLESDELFFSRLDFTRPDLAPVQSAVNAGDYRAARAALAAYYRARTTPTLNARPRAPRETTVKNALASTYSVSGILHTFPDGKVDWSARDVKDPNTGEHNPNWCWEFNRFQWWHDLTSHYLLDPVANEASGKRLTWELRDWLDNSPLELESHGLTPHVRWRTLECAGRLDNYWLVPFLLLKGTPLLAKDDDLLIDWVKAFYLHARYLEASAERTTNRGAGAASALFVGGVMFPEFTESKSWIDLGLRRLDDVLTTDLLPDGVYNELSPGYLDHTLPNYEQALSVARANGITVPASFRVAIERMFNYMLYLSEPNRHVPPLNDSQTLYSPLDVRLRAAARLFPERPDFQWFTSDGANGTPPTKTSTIFPNAGHVIMRSGWSRTDSYLFLDAGPAGYGGHAHEDKLALCVDGYGVRHLIESGPYDYVDVSPYRKFSFSTFSKTAPLIDGLGQNRKGLDSLQLKKSEIFWQTSPQFDYAAGTYGVDPEEGWGPSRLRPAETTRHVFYLKPDAWVVIDAFKPLDDKLHTYTALFQCNDDNVETESSSRRVTVQLKAGEFDPFTRTRPTTDQPSLTITPVAPAGQTLKILRGQEPPEVAGWRFEKQSSWKKQAIPTARYDYQAAGNVALAYVLAAAPSGAPGRSPVAETVATKPGTFGVRVTVDPKSPPVTLLIALDRKSLRWQGKSYDVPSLIVTGTGIHPWPTP